MKKNILFIIFLFAGFSLWAQTATKPAGSGTSSSPYLIATLDNLYWVTQNSGQWGKYYKQTADINAAATKNWNGGTGFSPIGNSTTKFNGTYNGQGYTIDSLTINQTSIDYIGLFGQTGSSPLIENLALTHENITESAHSAGLVGKLSGGTVQYCYVTGSVTGTTYLGGIVGDNYGTIQDCYASISINSDFSGGIVGDNNGTIQDCYSLSVSGSSYSGALVGGNNAVVLNSFWNTDTMTKGMDYGSGATGESTAEMKKAMTYLTAGWSSTVWNIGDGINNGYPYLKWQNPTGTSLLASLAPSGSGTSAAPYQIATLENLYWVSQNPSSWSSYFIQTANINAAATKTWDSGAGFFPIGNTTKFSGHYNGQGHTIDSLTINRPIPSSTYAGTGLFGNTGLGSVIDSLGLENVNITGKNFVGGLAGVNVGLINNSYSTGNVSGNENIGGLVGYNKNDTIANSYSTCSVNGNISVGGLDGFNYYANITNSYSTGHVSGGSYLGGLLGSNYSGTITHSFWDTQTSKQSTSAGGTGKTTAEMQTESTFTDSTWDFQGETANGTADIWGINPTVNDGYPYLSWQGSSNYAVMPSGSGTSSDPYKIATLNNLYWLSQNSSSWSSYFIQTADINAAATKTWYSGAGFSPIGHYNSSSDSIPFNGTYNGQGHVIDSLTINRNSTQYIGLFGYTGNSSSIENIGLTHANITGSYAVGGLVGLNGGTIYNCYATGSISSPNNDVGGLVGFNGGAGMVQNSYASGGVSGSSLVGGLVGQNVGTVQNSYATDSVSGTTNVGGLVGQNNWSIQYTYATGSVSGSSSFGGLVGYNSNGTVSHSFWDTQTSKQNTSAGGTGKTTAEMETMTTFTDSTWDFKGETANGTADTWNINMYRNSGYPFLSWQYPNDPGQTPPASGDGSTGNPYQIANLANLYWLSQNPTVWDSAFIQTADIKAAATRNWYSGAGFPPIGSVSPYFSGTYNGQGHAIDSLYISRSSTNNIGLFGTTSGTLSNKCLIEELGLTHANISGNTNVGALVGSEKYTDMVQKCYVTGSIKGTSDIGGLVGGLVGQMQNCYSMASVSGGKFVGGLTGYLYGSITNCYATGKISGTYAGGLSGGDAGCGDNVYMSTWNSDTIATGIAGFGTGGGNTTAELKTKSTFITGNYNWDFTHVWGIDSLLNSGYPYLLSQKLPPIAISYSPDSAATGMTVTISGIEFTGATAVSFGDSAAASFTVVNNDTIKAIVGSGASGKVLVTTPSGTDTLTGFTFVAPPSGLSYKTDTISAIYKTTITNDSSTVTGTVDSYSINPSLPSGLNFNKKNGVIGGTPTIISARADYKVVAHNIAGTDTATVNITVNKKKLTVTGATATNKVYDGNTTDTISGASLVGVVGSDNVKLVTPEIGTFAQDTVGTNISVTAGLMLAGSDTANYSLIQPTGLSANITKKTLTVTGAIADNKVYDGNKTDTISGASLAGVVGSDNVNLVSPGTGTFAQAAVGNSIPVTAGLMLAGSDTANYSLVQPTGLSANITKKTLTVSGAVADNKVYDGNSDDTISGASLVGLIGSDNVTLVSPATGSFAQTSVGTGISVTAGLMLAGSDTANYSLTQPNGLSANITKKTLTVSGAVADSKVYDGNTTDTISGATLVGVVGSDNVTLATPASGTFAQSTVGTGIPVTTAMSLTGTDAGNYSLTQPSGLAADITAALLSVTANNQTKTYDGSVFTGFTVSYSGFVGGETQSVLGGTLSFSGSAVTATDAGTYVITPSGLTSGNYKITFVNGSLKIQKADQTISFGSLPQKHEGQADFGISAMSTSGLPVTFSSSDNAIASVSDTTVTIVASGSCTIFADQPGNNNYNPAPEVGQLLNIIGLGFSRDYKFLFSPNGDGINDVWKIPNISEMGRVQVKVYDRWGSIVYQSSNYQNNWNGTYRGNPLPVGAYICVIKSSKLGAFTGIINLIR